MASENDRMASEYDKRQDVLIGENAKAIGRLSGYVREIRDHFKPEEEERRFKRLRRFVVFPVLKIVGAFVFVCGLWDFMGWYIDRVEISRMARRSADVAQKLYYQENNPEVATEFLDRAIELEADNPDFRFMRAYMQGMAATRMLSNLKRPYTKSELDLAHKSYAEAVYLEGLDPKRPEPYILQAQILAVLNESKRARQAIEKAIALDPKNDFAYIRLAMIQLDCDKDVEGAERSLDKAVELNPKSKWAWLWKGVVALASNSDIAAARENCRKALELDPKFDLAHYNLAWALASGKDKDYDIARAELKKALAVNPDYKEAFYAMGMFYGYEDNYAVANVWMEKAIELDAKFLPAQKWRGIICGEMKQYGEAIKNFDAAIHLDPMNADLYVRRAKMYAALGKVIDAKRDLNFALELDSKNKRSVLYLGNLEEDDAKAIALYDRALQIDDKYDEAYAAKAQALVRQKKFADALSAIGKAIDVTNYKPERFEKIKKQIETKLDVAE